MVNSTSLKISKRYFDKSYFTSGSYDTYEADVSTWSSSTAKEIFSYLKKISRPKILDVGCAQGYFIAQFQKEYEVEVKGLEISDYAFKNAEKTVKNKILRGDVLNGSIFRPNAFDAVICFEVFQYLNSGEMKKAVKNIFRWTKTYLFFCAPYKHSRHSSQNINPDKGRITVLTQKEYIKLFSDNGLYFLNKFNSGNGGEILVFKK